MVEVDEHATVKACLRGVVPRDHPQTPQAAEYFGAAYAALSASGPSVLYDDCLNVVCDFFEDPDPVGS